MSSTSRAAGALVPLDPRTIRPDFPILEQVLHGDRPLVYFDNASTTQQPRQVIQHVVDVYERTYANVHRGIHWLSERSTDLYEDARVRVQQFIGAAEPEEVIFTPGTTAGINLVARSWGEANLHPGDEILLTEMEHHANLVPWQQLAAKTGAVLRHIPITDDGLLDLSTLDELLTPQTKLVAFVAVSNMLGTVNPVAEIVRRAHDVGALALVDAAQSVPHLKTDVQAWGADFVVFSAHKMLGPSGVGVLYGRRELLEAMPPFIGGGSMIRRVELDSFTPADLPNRFEAGTPPIAQAIGLARAIDYLEQIGLDAIHEHEQLLTVHAHRRLEEVGGIRIFGPRPEQKGGIISFLIDGVHAHDSAQVLDRQGVAVRAGHHCTMPLHARLGVPATARASFYLYNTLEEVDHFIEAIEKTKSLFKR